MGRITDLKDYIWGMAKTGFSHVAAFQADDNPQPSFLGSKLLQHWNAHHEAKEEARLKEYIDACNKTFVAIMQEYGKNKERVEPHITARYWDELLDIAKGNAPDFTASHRRMTCFEQREKAIERLGKISPDMMSEEQRTQRQEVLLALAQDNDLVIARHAREALKRLGIEVLNLSIDFE